MVSNSSVSWFLVGTAGCTRIAALAVASVIAAVSVATAAEPSEAALVESVSGKSLDVCARGNRLRPDASPTLHFARDYDDAEGWVAGMSL